MKGLVEWRKHIDAGMQCLCRSPSDRLIFVTPIIDIRIIDVHDDIAVVMREVVGGFKREFRHCLASTGRIKRGTRWTGAIEWDLLHPNYLGGRRKRELAEALKVNFDTLTSKQRVLVTHAHIVIDTRGHQSSSAVTSALAQQWPGPYRVVSKTLHADKTVRENLERLASYCTKFRMRYSQAWLGTRTEYRPNFEPEWRDALERLISSVGLEAMTVSNVVSRAGATVPKCTRLSPEATVPQRFSSGLEVSQLMIDREIHNTITDDSVQKVHHTIIEEYMPINNTAASQSFSDNWLRRPLAGLA